MLKVFTPSGDVHNVAKLIVDNEGIVHVWSNTWYGHHVIGQDCEWVEHAPQIQNFKNQIRQLEHANVELFCDAIKFHKWLLFNNWEEHSSGEYWHRSKNKHDWPPDEICTEKELFAKYWQQNFNNKYDINTM